ncbi:hypothetical protein CPB84DRAFT_1753148 [Gymnopilus junonius]|uniref:Uncharacterized protein n=1 Tax=Gymnopilus junonius TaxID=109634 RepID=A0A9P5NAD8_GYMJU|nr:hypothetical protein CPB84DRAFT_1753148 [Gymnopilus junonius]
MAMLLESPLMCMHSFSLHFEVIEYAAEQKPQPASPESKSQPAVTIIAETSNQGSQVDASPSPRKSKATATKDSHQKQHAKHTSVESANVELAQALFSDGVLPVHGAPNGDDAMDEMATLTASDASDASDAKNPVQKGKEVLLDKGKAPVHKVKAIASPDGCSTMGLASGDESDDSLPPSVLVAHTLKEPVLKKAVHLSDSVSPKKGNSKAVSSSSKEQVSIDEPCIKPDPDADATVAKTRLYRKPGKAESIVISISSGSKNEDVKPAEDPKGPGASIASSGSGDEKDSDSDSATSEDGLSPDLIMLHAANPALPCLKWFAILKPYHHLQQSMSDDGDNSMLLSFTAIYKSMDHSLHAEASGANAVFLTAGTVAECNLQTGAKHGFGDGYQVKKILLYPFIEDHAHTISFLGTVANFDEIFGHWVNSSLLYSMRKEGPTSPGSTPAKKASFFVASGTSAGGAACYPTSLAFSDTVPVYDSCKKPFHFLTEDFEGIKCLPLYKHGKDLLPFSIVTVGYTFNTFNALGNELSSLFNIQFVIYLGSTKEDNPFE